MTPVEPVDSTASVDGSAVVARVIRRIVPFIFCCYVVAYVDRVNIGFAARDLQRDLSLSDWAYGFGGGLFFFGYFLFEIPSNLLLQRIGARIWIARIMIVWGIVSMATIIVRDPLSHVLDPGRLACARRRAVHDGNPHIRSGRGAGL